VIRGEDELSRFEAGEILVCPSTHSSWAVVFARAAAVVTDHGGVLSHPAIVAREYGIPAVVGTGSATTHARPESISKRAPSTTRTSLRARAGPTSVACRPGETK